MLSCCITLCECLHCGGDLSAGGDRGSCSVLVCRCCCRRVRLLSSVRQLVWREVDNAVRAGTVQAAEDIQTLVLASVEVQTEDGWEDEQHHGEVKHDHNCRLWREIQREKREKQSEKRQRTVCEITDTLLQLWRVPFVSQTTAQKVKL